MVRIQNKLIFKTLLIVAFVLSAIAIVRIFHYMNEQNNPLVTNKYFRQQQINSTFHLFDLGVTDINNDNLLDIYTSNHSYRQLILINKGQGKFRDQLVQTDLSQYPEFAGSEPSDIEPIVKKPGVYIYWDIATLIIRTVELKDIGAPLGKIRLRGNVFIKKNKGFNLSTSEETGSLTIELAGQGNSIIEIASHKWFYQPFFKLNNNLPLEQIFIGPEGLHPSDYRFTFLPKDRHGLAWADYNGDHQLDVFIVRGGLGGKMKKGSDIDKDEFFVQDNSVFKERTLESGLVKNSCPSRQVAWMDFNGDTKLDIYVACGRSHPPRALYPNQLHLQQDNGKFVDIAKSKNLDIAEDGHFIWLDSDNDNDLDLFWVDKEAFWLYVNQDEQFTSYRIDNHAGRVNQITVSDYDRDGDLDIFVASTRKNALLINTKGIYKPENPQEIGLPAASYSANWVDYDNDGRIDLHVLPQGLYRQRSDHKYEATKLLSSKSSKLFYSAFCTWFDVNNDGKLDLLMAVRKYSLWNILKKKIQRIFPSIEKIFEPVEWKPNKWKIMLYRNVKVEQNNHWLQIKLVGSKGNSQAIGAMVEVVTPQATQIQQVGQAEGSIYSQGHYRVYFGLGNYENIKKIRVLWTDGYIQIINSPADRLLTINRERKDVLP